MNARPHNAKLDARRVRAMLLDLLGDGLPARTVAAKYGVSLVTTYLILKGVRWSKVWRRVQRELDTEESVERLVAARYATMPRG